MTEIEEWLLISFVDCILYLFVEFAARFVGERNFNFLRFVVRLRPLAILRECRLARMT